jgi:hypothetical protein
VWKLLFFGKSEIAVSGHGTTVRHEKRGNFGQRGSFAWDAIEDRYLRRVRTGIHVFCRGV